MYLSKKMLRYIFTSLKVLDPQSDHNRKLKVSQLRHLLAASIVIRSNNIKDGQVDLSPKDGKHRAAFKEAVGDIVKLNESGLYTQDFGGAFAEAPDYKVTNNFLTTLVRWTGPYPSQKNPSPDKPVLEVIKIRDRWYAKLAANIGLALKEDYNIDIIKPALAFWISRFENLFEEVDISDLKEIERVLNNKIKTKFDSTLKSKLLVSAEEISKFIAESGLTYDDLQSEEIPDLTFLRDEFKASEALDDDSELDALPLRDESSANHFSTLKEPYLVVFAGPPGTGKSRCARILADMIATGKPIPKDLTSLQTLKYPIGDASVDIYSAQFHASYSYEEFMEGLRPVSVRQSGKSDTVYEVVPGIFRASVETARAYYEIALQPKEKAYEIEIAIGYDPKSSWQLLENPVVSMYRLARRKGILTYEGKAIADINNGDNPGVILNGDVKPLDEGIYKVKWRPTDEKPRHIVLTIDEFNRGNPSVIFGEALTALESTKRMGCEEEAAIQLPYSGKDLRVPPNFHIIASMNTSDRTLVGIDLALKRRFRFVYLKPEFGLLNKYASTFTSNGTEIVNAVREHFEAINIALKKSDVSVDQYLGHSYAFLVLNRLKQELLAGDVVWGEILREVLAHTWRFELHEIIRNILGPLRIDKFSVLFAKGLLEAGWSQTLGFDQNRVSEMIKEFLRDPVGEIDWLDKAS